MRKGSVTAYCTCTCMHIHNHVYIYIVLAYFKNAADVSQGLQMVDMDHYWSQNVIKCVAKTLQKGHCECGHCSTVIGIY